MISDFVNITILLSIAYLVIKYSTYNVRLFINFDKTKQQINAAWAAKIRK